MSTSIAVVQVGGMFFKRRVVRSSDLSSCWFGSCVGHPFMTHSPFCSSAADNLHVRRRWRRRELLPAPWISTISSQGHSDASAHDELFSGMQKLIAGANTPGGKTPGGCIGETQGRRWDGELASENAGISKVEFGDPLALQDSLSLESSASPLVDNVVVLQGVSFPLRDFCGTSHKRSS